MTVSSINPANFVDFHCHLDLYPNYLEMIRECEELGIKTLTVTNAPCVWTQNQMFVKNCQHIRTALGLHPQLAHARAREMHLFEKYLPETRYVGEVGLDGSPEYANTFELQRQVFQKILELCASAKGKVLTIHSRQAAHEVIEYIGHYLPPDKGRVVLHWFTGSSKEALRAVEAGCYFSVNIKMLESPRRKALVELLPQERILTESDGPFVRLGRSAMCPKDMWKPIQKLAELWSTDERTAARIIKNNLKSLLS
jgi:TatD DNase family protein